MIREMEMGNKGLGNKEMIAKRGIQKNTVRRDKQR